MTGNVDIEEDIMPKFLDHHSLPPWSPEQLKGLIAQLKSAIASKKPDKFGVTIHTTFLAPPEVWCYTDAPNAEAVVKFHEALGVKVDVGAIKEVTVLV